MAGQQRWVWAVVTAAGGTVFIGLGAFWLSFIALADLARRSGIAATQAWVWPLLVDGLIVVATIAVVALDGHASTWYAWTLLVAGALVSVVANATHALVAADSTVPGVLAAAVASVPPLVLLASTHLTVQLVRSTQRGRGTADVRETAPQGLPEAQLEPAPRPTISATRSKPLALSRDLTPPAFGAAVRATGQPKSIPNGSTASIPISAAITPSRSSNREQTEAAMSRRAEAARLRAAGWSNRKIAAHLSVHPSTVGRWAARHQSAAPANPESSEENPS